METVVGSIAAVMVTAIICAASVYGCTNNNQQYYKAMSDCVSSGGSAVPTSANGAGSLVCIRK